MDVAAEASSEGDSSDSTAKKVNGHGSPSRNVIVVAPAGQVVLDVVFETTKKTLKATRRPVYSHTSQHGWQARPLESLQPVVRRAFLVDATVLKAQSRYFATLLGDSNFVEGRGISSRLLSLSGGASVEKVLVVRPADTAVAAQTVEESRVTLTKTTPSSPAQAKVAARVPPGKTKVHENKNTNGAKVVANKTAKMPLVQPPKSLTKDNQPKINGTRIHPAYTPQTSNGYNDHKVLEESAVKHLAWINITDEDRATRLAWRDRAFETLLRILHGQTPELGQGADFRSITNLAVLADRFDCVKPVARYFNTTYKLKLPSAPSSNGRKAVVHHGPDHASSIVEDSMSTHEEDVLRQRIYVFWLLEMPAKFQAATRELIMNGSHQWTSYPHSLRFDDPSTDSVWWYLPEGLEEELRHRRARILMSIGSIQRYFLALYTGRATTSATNSNSSGSSSSSSTTNGNHAAATRQCILGYDSSVACDSFQLGELVRFLSSKHLVSFGDFSSSSSSTSSLAHSTSSETSLFTNTLYDQVVPIGHIIDLLKKMPNYQIDKNHNNCGVRTRILPILEFVSGRVASAEVAVDLLKWKQDRARVSWWCWWKGTKTKTKTKTKMMMAGATSRFVTTVHDDTTNAEDDDDHDDDDGSNGNLTRHAYKQATAKSRLPYTRKPDFVVPGQDSGQLGQDHHDDNDDDDDDDSHQAKQVRVFRYADKTNHDQRMRLANGMGLSAVTRDFFTADAWDWDTQY